jgi:tight adherence protein B
VTGLLLGLCFATGIALVWLGMTTDIALPSVGGRVRSLGRAAGVDVASGALIVGSVVAGVLAGLLAWLAVSVPVLGLAAGVAGAYAPWWWLRRRREQRLLERERAWPAALAQLADALEAGLAFPAAVALAAEAGPGALRRELAAFHARLRSNGLEAALDGLAAAQERAADTVALLLRAGLVDLPAGGLAPVLRELSTVLAERFEACEKARSRAAKLQVEEAVLALSPIGLLLLVGLASPAYLDAYRTTGGTLVGIAGGLMILGCYLLMRRLGRVPEPRRTGGAT